MPSMPALREEGRMYCNSQDQHAVCKRLLLTQKERLTPWNRASNGYRFRDQQTAILRSFEAFELILRTPPNVRERIQTTSGNRRVRQYRGYDKAAVRRMVNTLFLRRYDGIFPQKYFDVPLGLNSTKPLFSE